MSAAAPFSDTPLSLTAWLEGIEDPRVRGMVSYPLSEILFVVFIGTLCGLEDIDDLVDFAEEETVFLWLQGWFEFKNGIASACTIRRVLSRVDSKSFEKTFTSWVSHWSRKGLVAIDGKCLKGTSEGKPHDALYTVNAYSHDTGLVLGQCAVDGKSNEITAVPELLDQLSISGGIVTLDAMGTQKNIAECIRKKKADYILALKGNQGTLHKDVVDFYEKKQLSVEYQTFETLDFGHGRIEEREIKVTDDIKFIQKMHPHWKDLKTIIRLISRRTDKKTGKTTQETRYYISSLEADPILLLKAIRGHWAIENQLHWTLDVTFKEDASRLRKDNTSQNMALIRKVVFNILKKHPLKKTMKGKRLKALMNESFRKELIIHS